VCTIVALKGVSPHYPLIVAANRDEYYARPASRPAIVHEAPRVVAGLDLTKHGTWMGANEHGIFCAVTNQRTYHRPDPKRLSRGKVVLEALAQRSVGAIDELLQTLDPGDYNAFNLMYGDADALRVAYAREDHDRIEIAPLTDGISVLANDRMGSPEFPKADRALELVRPHVGEPWDTLAPALARMLADHDKPPMEALLDPPSEAIFDKALLRELQAICIHTPLYGTRSATILALECGRVAHYLFAEGSPCTAKLEELALFA
jgi:uncharacterized protein with NRDE domain